MRSFLCHRTIGFGVLTAFLLALCAACTDAGGGDGNSGAEGDGVTGNETGRAVGGEETVGTTDTAISDSATAGETVAPTDDTSGTGGETGSTLDLGSPEAGGGDATAACPGGPGCACKANSECDNGFCIDTPAGSQCAKPCIDKCAEGFACKNVQGSGGDTVALCLALFPRLCEPCGSDADCLKGGSDALCVPYGDGKAILPGAFCGGACDDANNKCPTGYVCGDVTSLSGAKGKQCKKVTGECACSPKASEQKLSTVCGVANAFGTCPGNRVCSDKGLSACDAPTPATETCDGADQDCDGKTD